MRAKRLMLLAVAITTFAATAAAQEHQHAVVVLRDGSVVQGDLLELVDGDHVTVKMADGTDRRVAWADILSNTLIPAPGGPVVPSAPPPRPWYSGSNGVAVKIEATNYDDPPSLDQAVGGDPDGAWQHVCVAPCNIKLDPSGLYRISDGTELMVDKYGNTSTSRMLDSKPFHIAPRSQTLSVNGTSVSERVIGWVFLPASAAFFVPAGLAFGGSFSSDSSFNATFRLAFGIPMAVGGAAFFGIGLWFVLSHTTVQDDNGQTIARRPLKLPAGLALGPEGLVF